VLTEADTHLGPSASSEQTKLIFIHLQ